MGADKALTLTSALTIKKGQGFPMATPIIPDITKRIVYDATTEHYDLYIAIGGGPEQHIGAAPTYAIAEQRCQAYARDFLAGDLRYAAVELEGGANAPQTITMITHLPDDTFVRSALDSDSMPPALHFETATWYICVDTDGYVFVRLCVGGETLELDLTSHTRHPLRDLLNGDTIDRLLACAYACAADHQPPKIEDGG